MQPFKYVFTDEVKGNLRRIRAIRDFGDVLSGSLGGFLEKEENLSHEGDCWVYDNAIVRDDAQVLDHAKLKGSSIMFGRSTLEERATVSGKCALSGFSQVTGSSRLGGEIEVHGNATVTGTSSLFGNIKVMGSAIILNSVLSASLSRISVSGHSSIIESNIYGDVLISGNAVIEESFVNSRELDPFYIERVVLETGHFYGAEISSNDDFLVVFASGDKIVAYRAKRDVFFLAGSWKIYDRGMSPRGAVFLVEYRKNRAKKETKGFLKPIRRREKRCQKITR